MEEKDFNKLVEKFGPVVAKQISESKDEMRAGLMTEDQFKTEVESLAKAADIDGINEKLDNFIIDLKKQKETEEAAKPKTLADQLRAKADIFKGAAEEKKGFSIHLDTKANVATTSWTSNTSGTYEMGFNQEAFLGMVFEQYFKHFPLSGGTKTIYYSDQTTVTRNADNKAEAAAAPESVLAWTQRSLGMGKILDSIPITHEAMLDIEQLIPEVEMFLSNNMRLHIDSNMWSGDGSLPNWSGIYAKYATDFTQAIAQGATIDSIDGANIYDLIATIGTYIANGKESKYEANVCFMNPRDVLKCNVIKNANDNYVLPPFVSRDGKNVAGTIVIPTAQVTANTMAMGDARHVRYYDVEGVDLEYGLDGSDFTEDLITLKARKRGNLLLKTADATAFYKVTSISQRVANITA